MARDKHTSPGWMVLLGATSGIAGGTARSLAGRGYNLVLSGRDADRLKEAAEDLKIRHSVEVRIHILDITSERACRNCVDEILDQIEDGALRGVLLCYGTMPPQEEMVRDSHVLESMVWVNFTSAVLLLQEFANRLMDGPACVLGALSSVAAERGRASNYLYGSAKAGLSLFLNGLRHDQRLRGTKLSILTIHPGMVDTPLTIGIVDPKSPLVASPEKVGKRIATAMERKLDGVLHVPLFWKWILLVIRLLPAFVFHRTRF